MRSRKNLESGEGSVDIASEYTKPKLIELPVEPAFNAVYRDDGNEIYYKFNGKQWLPFKPVLAINEPIEITEKKNEIVEIFGANCWVEGKRIDETTFEFEVSRLMDSYTLTLKAPNLRVSLKKKNTPTETTEAGEVKPKRKYTKRTKIEIMDE